MPTLKDFIPPKLTVQSEDKKLNHIFNEEDCYALWAAHAAGRPLLVRGKPGTGKSQMAKAIAQQLGWAFVSEVVQGNTDLSDLHYHFDAIGRLGEAQANQGQNKETLNPVHFLSPGAFWWAYNWKTASEQYERCSTHLKPAPSVPTTNKKWQAATGGVVLLIDEIDKADPDLPNGLLETLGQYQFNVPYLNRKDTASADINPVTADPSRLLVIISTNEERELPTAFMRRCFVHTLVMEESSEVNDDGLERRYEWLIERGKLHFGNDIADSVYLHAAKLLWKDRAGSGQNQYSPGLAEYIDLLNALNALDKSDQSDRLEKIAGFALQKEVKE